MGIKNTAIRKPHGVTHSHKPTGTFKSHSQSPNTHSTPIPQAPASPAPLATSPLPPPPPLPLPRTLVYTRPSMDVRSLIEYFNNKSAIPVIKHSPLTRGPIYNLNGKVKNLVLEFSKSSSESPPDLRLLRPPIYVKKPTQTTTSNPENGGNADGLGVFQATERSRQVSQEGNSAKHVTSVQYTDHPEHSKSKKQAHRHRHKPTNATVESTQAVHRPSSGKTRRNEHISAQKPQRSAGSVNHTRSTSHGEISRVRGDNRHRAATPAHATHMLKARSPVVVSNEQHRQTPIDSVVISARNSERRMSRSTSQPSSNMKYQGSSSPIKLGSDEGHYSRTPNKSTEPLPLKIVKRRKSNSLNHTVLKTFEHEQQTLSEPKVTFLAPPAQRYVEPWGLNSNSDPSSVSDLMPVPPEGFSPHRQSSGSERSQKHVTFNEPPTEPHDFQSKYLGPPPIMVVPSVGRVGSKGSNYDTSGGQNKAHIGSIPPFTEVPNKMSYQAISQGIPRMKIYDDAEWMSRALQRNLMQTDGEVYSSFDSFDGVTLSWTSWSSPGPLEEPSSLAETISIVHSPSSPPTAPFRNYAITSSEAAGKYHSLPVRIIKPMAYPSLVNKIELHRYNPRFSTFVKQDSSPASLPSTVSHEEEAYVELTEEDAELSVEIEVPAQKAHKSPLQRMIARENAMSRASSTRFSSDWGMGVLSRMWSRANSVDIESKRYTSRRRF